MKIEKLSILVLFCGVLSIAATAAGKYKLPQQHIDMADANIGASCPSNTFIAQSVQAARSDSPFAVMPDLFGTDMDESSSASATADKMVDYASAFLGTRYRLGASGPKAFDCSGFTSYIYRNFGITLNRTSRSQFLQGEKVSVNNLRPGDLLFFSSRSSGRGNVGHVAMVVSVDPDSRTCKFIHASVKYGVTYNTFPDNGYYENHFMGARRILGTSLDANPV